MATLRGWINQFEESKSEPVDLIVLGGDHYHWEDYRREDWPEWDRWNLVTPIEDVPNQILDREFDDGFGGNISPNLCGWSENWLVFSDNYDGAEGICWVPRYPVDHEPTRPGGG